MSNPKWATMSDPKWALLQAMTLNELRDVVYDWAKSKGWWEPSETRTIGDLIALMHSELSEALEEHRDGRAPDAIYFRDRDGAEVTDESIRRAVHLGIGDHTAFKPEGIPIELADVVIRIVDFCGRYGIDLDEAVRLKLAYNHTRPWKHGGRSM